MNSNDSSANVAANDTSNVNVLQSKQVAPLPIGPGGANQTKNQMNQTNTQLTMLASQATANTLYDPPVPKPVTKQLVQPFCSGSDGDPLPPFIIVVAGLLIVYGLISK
jgi:hypothetical protein